MLHLGSLRGTSIDVEPNFIILLIFFVVMNYNPELGIHYALIWIPILFVSVLIHELAHAASLFDMHYKYADVLPLDEVLAMLGPPAS